MMRLVRAAFDEIYALLAQMVSSLFRHGLPLTDKIAARTALTNFVLHIHPVRVRRSWIRMSYTLCLGGLSFFLFIVLTVTGLYLMFYYVPSTGHAFQDMRDLQFVITFGGVVRNMHRWAAHLMVITVWLHMARVFLTGSYKKPREFNWAIGTTLLLITLLLSFTGYLLLGGTVVGDNALLRFYVLHVVGLPLFGFLLMVVHFWRVRKDGFSGGL